LGQSRLGPDLTNLGWAEWRDEKPDDTRRPKRRDAAWHFAHLYQPRIIIGESNHPPYRYLFEVRKVSGQRSSDALTLVDPSMPGPGQEVVPTSDAKALVRYLLSLDRSHALPEATVAAAGAPAAPGAAASTPAK
jgi:cytochrome c oxidase cbb3-type subunit 2